jgi:hypothetical protein
MKVRRFVLMSGAILSALVLAWAPAHAQTPTDTPNLVPTDTPTPPPNVFGSLSNFDVFNDTHQECHGFEIELDGLSSADIQFTFGAPYERYGNPTLVDFAGNVYVRYESPYDSVNQVFTATTPLAPSVITPTLGHACWTGGSPDYPTSGCEHFGVGFAGNPTNTVYRWLVADPANPGALQPSGTKVSIPAPIWNVSPAPQPGAPPIVQAVLPAEPPEVNMEYGDAQWVKVFVTEAPEAVELHHLVTDDPAVPQEPAETEIEWVLLQAGPKAINELNNEKQIGAGNQSVTRRYEFYEYTGAYDPENHEAKPVSESPPDAGDIGNYIGAQMAAVNLEPVGPTPLPTDTPTGTPPLADTPTPTPTLNLCAGDCDGNGHVAIAELVTLVNIALEITPLSECEAGNLNGDSRITIDEIITAVNAILSGCGG